MYQFRNDFIIQQYALDMNKKQDQFHYVLLLPFSILNLRQLGDFLICLDLFISALGV